MVDARGGQLGEQRVQLHRVGRGQACWRRCRPARSARACRARPRLAEAASRAAAVKPATEVLPLVPVTAAMQRGCAPKKRAAISARRRRGSGSRTSGTRQRRRGAAPGRPSTAAAPRAIASAMKRRPSARLPGSAANSQPGCDACANRRLSAGDLDLASRRRGPSPQDRAARAAASGLSLAVVSPARAGRGREAGLDPAGPAVERLALEQPLAEPELGVRVDRRQAEQRADPADDPADRRRRGPAALRLAVGARRRPWARRA